MVAVGDDAADRHRVAEVAVGAQDAGRALSAATQFSSCRTVRVVVAEDRIDMAQTSPRRLRRRVLRALAVHRAAEAREQYRRATGLLAKRRQHASASARDGYSVPRLGQGQPRWHHGQCSTRSSAAKRKRHPKTRPGQGLRSEGRATTDSTAHRRQPPVGDGTHEVHAAVDDERLAGGVGGFGEARTPPCPRSPARARGAGREGRASLGAGPRPPGPSSWCQSSPGGGDRVRRDAVRAELQRDDRSACRARPAAPYAALSRSGRCSWIDVMAIRRPPPPWATIRRAARCRHRKAPVRSRSSVLRQSSSDSSSTGPPWPAPALLTNTSTPPSSSASSSTASDGRRRPRGPSAGTPCAPRGLARPAPSRGRSPRRHAT